MQRLKKVMHEKMMRKVGSRDNRPKEIGRTTRAVVRCLALGLLALLAPIAAVAQITEIIDATGDGAGNTLTGRLGNYTNC